MNVSRQMLKVRKDPRKCQIPLLEREAAENIALFDLNQLNAAQEESMSLHSFSFSHRLELSAVLSHFK